MGWRLVLKRFLVALRAYFKHCDQPPTRKEAALLVPVFLLRTGLLFAEVVDELSRDDLDVVLRARKSGVDVDSFRGVGAPPLMKRDERVALLERRQKTLLRVWRTYTRSGTGCAKSMRSSGPKAPRDVGDPQTAAAVGVGHCGAEESRGGGRPRRAADGGTGRRLLGAVKAGRECRAPTTVGCVSAVSRDELRDVLEGRLAGSEVAPLKELREPQGR